MKKDLYPVNPILIVDDEDHALNSYKYAFLSAGINNVLCCSDSRKVIDIMNGGNIELALLDLLMPHVSGEKLLREIVEKYPGVPVIMVTGVSKIDSAVECMRSGAFDYILKPVIPKALLSRVKRCLEMKELQTENVMLKNRILSEDLNQPEAFSDIVTRNKHMIKIFQYCEAVAASRQPVLITGETGVGKELFANVIHKLSTRSGAFVPVNIAGFDDNLLSDTLFGHRKGAFTGAVDNRTGVIEKAYGGTLFLDEIGDLSLPSQVKLLRLLQENEYSPLGSDIPKISDARVVLATNKNLADLQMNSDFRKDLYYRISTHHVHIPPLRERKDDIKPLIDHFIDIAAKELNKKRPQYHPELITRLKLYHFPGNIRELQGMVYDAISNHDSKMLSMDIFKKHIEMNIDMNSRLHANNNSNSSSDLFDETQDLPLLKAATNALVKEAMKRGCGNQSVAAKLIGISPQAISARLKKMKL